MENYLKKLHHKLVLYPFNKINHIHQLIKQIDDKKPREDFFAWLFDVVQYGLVVEVVRIAFSGFQGLGTSVLYLLAFGMIRWLWLDFVKETKIAISNR